jgi:hypothetical protein
MGYYSRNYATLGIHHIHSTFQYIGQAEFMMHWKLLLKSCYWVLTITAHRCQFGVAFCFRYISPPKQKVLQDNNIFQRTITHSIDYRIFTWLWIYFSAWKELVCTVDSPQIPLGQWQPGLSAHDNQTTATSSEHMPSVNSTLAEMAS